MKARVSRCAWFLALLPPFLSLGCDAGDDGSPVLVVQPPVLDFGTVRAGSAASRRILGVENQGGGSAELWEAEVLPGAAACGTFAIVGEPWQDIRGGGGGQVEIEFSPSANGPEGCGCVSIATLRLGFDADPQPIDVLLVARGECGQPLHCVPQEKAFPLTLIGQSRKATIHCWNAEESAVTVESAGMAPGGDACLSAGPPGTPLPATLGQGEGIAIPVEFRPEAAGESSGILRVQAAGRVIEVPISGTSEPRLPRCSDGIPDDPDPVLESAAYAITLESPAVSAYEGTIRSRWYYDDQAPLVADVLLTTGGFAQSSCECGQDGHHAWWRDCAHEDDDLFVNIHAVPFDERVESWVRRIAVWDRLQVRGWEVLKIAYPDGSTWQDAGCNTLIVTWVCEL